MAGIALNFAINIAKHIVACRLLVCHVGCVPVVVRWWLRCGYLAGRCTSLSSNVAAYLASLLLTTRALLGRRAVFT